MGKRLTKEEKRNIIAMAANGVPRNTIAERLKRSRSAVDCTLEEEREARLSRKLSTIKAKNSRRINGRWVWQGS